MMTRKQDESRGGSNWNEQLKNPSFSRAGPWPGCAAPPPTSGIPSTASASRTQVQTESKRKIEDDIIKKVADVRMSPWSKGQELDEANAASARARARILELEKELEEITRKAMTTQVKALKTAKQMAMEATREDEAAMASSVKKSKKVMIESSSKILA